MAGAYPLVAGRVARAWRDGEPSIRFEDAVAAVVMPVCLMLRVTENAGVKG